MRVGARFGQTAAVGIQVSKPDDPAFTVEWLTALEKAGFAPEVDAGVIRLSGVGVVQGDRSVDIEIQLIQMDDHRVLEIRAPIRSESATFEVATLAAVRGGAACHLAKFDLEERVDRVGASAAFGLVARFHLYADHLSAEELTVMLALFLKEVDGIDNELATIMKSH